MSKNDFAREPRFSWLYAILNWPRLIIKRLYAWMMKWGDSPQAEKALFGFSFTESSFFPIPPDPLLITMVMANARKWVRLALITTVASVLGALLGYFIGFALFETLGQPIIDSYGLQEDFDSVGESYERNAFITIFTAGFTPIPFKVFTIASGLFHVNIITLILASLLSRGGRFFIVAWLSQKLGAKYKAKIERYIDILGLAFIALLVGGFVALRYVV
ncbi:MAG: YqaA family protein [Candidatus Saccharimonadales bacterium]